MATKRKRVFFGIGLGIGTVGAILIAFIVVRLVQVNREYRTNWPRLKMHLVQTISGDDSALFSKESLTRLKVDFAWADIYRQVSFMLLDEQYQVIMAKCDLVRDGCLLHLAHLTKGSGNGTVMAPYKPERLVDHGEFDFRLAPLQPVSKIILTYSGIKAETFIANDSVLHYHLSCTNLSIRYAADSPVDIFLSNGYNDDVDLRLDVLLIKCRDKIYFLFITPISYKTTVIPISPGELLKH